jgi:UDP-glucose 4-epimerase
MKILVVGGAGFLGANLVRYCLAQPGAEVTVLDSLEPRLRATTENLAAVWPRIRFIRGSLLEDAVVAQAVQGQDIVFNCAAQTSHPLSIQEPLFDAELNCLGNLKLLENLRQLNRRAIVVYASSSTVIGRAAGEVVDESHGERPLDIYSANKGVAEKYYRIYHRVHDLKTVAVRFANLYGPYGKGFPEFGFVNYFIHLARTGGEIRIYGEGAQTRNLLYAEDAAAAMWTAAHTAGLQGESWFAAHEEHLSVAQIAAAIVREVGAGTVTHVPWPDERKRIEIDAVRISSKRFRERTGWAPEYSLAEGLAKLLALKEEGAAG